MNPIETVPGTPRADQPTPAALGRLLQRLRCQACAGVPLQRAGDELVCAACGAALRVVSHAPLVVRTVEAFVEAGAFGPPPPPRSRLRAAMWAWHSRRERHFMRRIPALADAHLPTIKAALANAANRAVVDIGGGAGRFQGYLGGAADYTVVDIVEPDHRGLPADMTYLTASVGDLPIVDGAFDAALLIEVLEHLPDPGRALAEIARVLVPGGLLLLTTRQAWRTHGAPHDYFRYTRYGLQVLLDRAGFEPERFQPLGGPGSIIAATLENNVSLIAKPIVKQVVGHALWRAAAWADRTVFRANVEGPSPDTAGWLVLARRRESASTPRGTRKVGA